VFPKPIVPSLLVLLSGCGTSPGATGDHDASSDGPADFLAARTGDSGDSQPSVPMTVDVFPHGNAPRAAVLLTGPGVSEAGDVLFGSTSAPILFRSMNAAMTVVPDGLPAGTVNVRLRARDGTMLGPGARAFNVLSAAALQDWAGPNDPVVPIAEPAGYIGPIDNDWQNENDPSDSYFFVVSGDRNAPVVTIVNFDNGVSPTPQIHGTVDRGSGLFRFTIQRGGGQSDSFVGLYSLTGSSQAHRLVFFPDADSGLQLVLRITQ
jgi:hypothetical protein